MSKRIKNNNHGGKRRGAGRKPLPEQKRRKNVTIKMLPKAAKAFTKLAKKAGVSKGGVVEFFTQAPEAAKARKALLKSK